MSTGKNKNVIKSKLAASARGNIWRVIWGVPQDWGDTPRPLAAVFDLEKLY